MRKKSVIILIVVAIIVFMSSVLLQRTFASGPEMNRTENASTLHLQFDAYTDSLYSLCKLDSAGLNKEVFHKALTGYYNLKAENALNVTREILTVIDFSKSSSEKRMWVIDLRHHAILYHSLVAHGKNSGEQYASSFSNSNASNKSSLGFYVTDDTYMGKHGLSLNLNGMEKGFNDHARQRSVVVHAADYVSEEFVNVRGRLGRSQGCPALPVQIAENVIHDIQGGTCLFIYYPDQKYEQTSRYYSSETAVASFEKDKMEGTLDLPQQPDSTTAMSKDSSAVSGL